MIKGSTDFGIKYQNKNLEVVKVVTERTFNEMITNSYEIFLSCISYRLI